MRSQNEPVVAKTKRTQSLPIMARVYLKNKTNKQTHKLSSTSLFAFSKFDSESSNFSFRGPAPAAAGNLNQFKTNRGHSRDEPNFWAHFYSSASGAETKFVAISLLSNRGEILVVRLRFVHFICHRKA